MVDLVKDKLTLLFFVEGAEDLLYHMCTLEVLRELNNVALEGLGDQKLFSRAVDQVKHELNGVGASLVAADLNEVMLDHS